MPVGSGTVVGAVGAWAAAGAVVPVRSLVVVMWVRTASCGAGGRGDRSVVLTTSARGAVFPPSTGLHLGFVPTGAPGSSVVALLSRPQVCGR
ncbi:hypothetical protein GCM10027047_27610 [Rhodococcus aerolatus]